MVMSAAKTVDAYLASLPDDKRSAISTVRDLVLQNLPEGFVEAMGFGMIYYSIPLSRYPTTYNDQPLAYAALAAQKNFNAIYLMGVYGDPARAARFKEGFARACKKLDIGKSCVRFKSPDDLALDAIAETIAGVSVDKFIEIYERSRTSAQRARSEGKARGEVKRAKGSARESKAGTAAKSTRTTRSDSTRTTNAPKTTTAVTRQGAKTAKPISEKR